MSNFYASLSELQLKYGLPGVAPEQFNGAVMIPHDLPGDA